MKFEIANNNIVSTCELNQILDFCEKDGELKDITIIFKEPVEIVDILFIAGLILFNNQNDVKFKIECEFISENRKFELRQYLKQYEKLYGYKWSKTFVDINFLNVFLEGSIIENTLVDKIDYVASESFVPILSINETTIDVFFKSRADAHENEEASTLCDMYFSKKITPKNQEEEKYFNSQKSVKVKLLEYPIIHTFVFTLLYNKISPFVNSDKKGINKPIQRTEQLWEFTKEYIKGIYELAKNIVDHSSTGEGMITIRTYRDSESTDKTLETHVFDFGTKGIIPTLFDYTIRNSELSHIYKEDIEILKGEYSMHDFIAPTEKTRLNQQLYRDIAHYGVVGFYKLINKNDGFVESSSDGKNGERDIYKSSLTPIDKSLRAGTSYFFQLPFKHDLYRASEYAPPSFDWQGSQQTLVSISELLKIKVIKELNQATNKGSDKNMHLIDIKPIINIKNRHDESRLCEFFSNIKNESKINYIAINFSKIIIGASSLLRFLAHLSSCYSQSIIIYNLDFRLFDEIIENNTHFFEELKGFKNDIPFWYENKSVLIFSKLQDLDFNFADILFGKNEEEFQAINYIISHTFPNTNSILQHYNSPDYKFEIHECLKAYFSQSTLLPFDLLLFNDSNKLLFQSNLEALLMQEMIVNKEKEENHEQS